MKMYNRTTNAATRHTEQPFLNICKGKVHPYTDTEALYKPYGP
jgi:hypothetical protein